MLKKFLTLLPILLLTSCAANRNTELNDVLASKSNLESSFVTLIKDTYASAYKLSEAITGAKLYNKKETSGYTTLKSSGVSEQSVHDVALVIYRLCKAIDGIPHKNACVDSSNHEHILFFAKVTSNKKYTDTVIHNSQYRISLFFIIPKLNGQKATLALANTMGYESPLQEEEQRKAGEKRAEEQAKAHERYLASLKQLSKQTRALVLTRGTKICSIASLINKVGPQIYGFTQDTSNGKIEININNQLVWDWPQNWYACDHKPQ
ncbi:hypothetical protein [Celerinatantimonas sp. MCCC 1A17872]|uniref:hypothetical protein n=1 Tax=Celerinatantimonas sp. MCCC 1A17872 TaxID=3177514 RepID=UPI0038CB43EE